MRPALFCLLGLGLAGLLAWRCVPGAPSVALVDAAGRPLTAGSGPTGDSGELTEALRLIEAGEPDAARDELLEVIERGEHDGEACRWLAQLAVERQDVDEALDYGAKAVALLPESAPAHHAYASALAMQMMRGGMMAALKVLPRWKAVLERTLELDPADAGARQAQIGYYLFTPGLGDVERGLELARELETIDPVRGRVMQALAWRRKDEPERALELCRQGLMEHPEALELHLTLAGFLAEDERWEEAWAEFAAAREGPHEEAYYRSLHAEARARLEAGQGPERALELVQEYVQARPRGEWLPGPASARCLLGRALEALERPDEAREAYAQALRLDPASSEAADGLERLQ